MLDTWDSDFDLSAWNPACFTSGFSREMSLHHRCPREMDKQFVTLQ